MSKQAVDESQSSTVPRMLAKFRDEVTPVLMADLQIGNVMAVPIVEKIKVNVGLGEALKSAVALQACKRDICQIIGQNPMDCKAKKSISNFSLRAGQVIGISATLRSKRMWDFLDRLLNIALPRVRDFRGLSRRAFDGHGNYSIGLDTQTVFPEIDYNEIDRQRGLQVSIVTTARNDVEGERLLELLGVPFVPRWSS